MAGRENVESSKKRLKLDKNEASDKYSEKKGSGGKHKSAKKTQAGDDKDVPARKSPRERKPNVDTKAAMQDFLEAKKMRRNDNWADEEIDALLNGVESEWEVINAEQSGVFGSKARTEERKLESWGSIAQLVNA